MVKGRPVKVFRTKFSTPEGMTDFTKKYNVTIERDTIFLLKNRYLDAFFPFGSYDWFENRDYFFKYYKKINKLNEKNIKSVKQNIGELTSENIIVMAYADKEDKENYKKYAKTFGKLSLLKEYSDNPSIYTIFVNDKKSAE